MPREWAADTDSDSASEAGFNHPRWWAAGTDSDSASEHEDGCVECVVCMLAVEGNIVSLCRGGHFTCVECFEHMRSRGMNTCPTCRDPIDDRLVRIEVSESATKNRLEEKVASLKEERNSVRMETQAIQVHAASIALRTEAMETENERMKAQTKATKSKMKRLYSEAGALARTQRRLLSSKRGPGTRDSVTRSRFEQKLLYPPEKLLPQRRPTESDKEAAKNQKKIERQHAYMKCLQEEIAEWEQKCPTFLEQQRLLRSLEKGIETLTKQMSGLKFSKRRVLNTVKGLEKSESDLTTSVFLLKQEQDDLESRVGHLHELDDIRSKIESSKLELSRLNRTVDDSRSLNRELLDEQRHLDSLLSDLEPKVSSLQKEERSLKASTNRWKKKVKDAQATHKDLEKKNNDLMETMRALFPSHGGKTI